MPEVINIGDFRISRGIHQEIQLNIARLPTHTDINLPVHVFRAREDGPVLLLTGGMHGDEVNGIEIVRRMIFRDHLMPDKGTVIAIPLVNVYGFIQSDRGVPDGKDINRSFPGIKGGSLARLLAYTLTHKIIPEIDVGVDFHSGGASRANYPQIRCSFDVEDNLPLAKAFAPPLIIHSSLIDKSFRKAAEKKGKSILVYETGESNRFDESGIKEGINGTIRLLHYLGMKNSKPQTGHSPAVYSKTSWIRAKSAGLFQATVQLGDVIRKRQVLGYISDPYGENMLKVTSSKEGRIIGLNYGAVVHKGDAILHLAYNSVN